MAGQGAGPQPQGTSQGGGKSPAQVKTVRRSTGNITKPLCSARKIRQILRHPKGSEASDRSEEDLKFEEIFFCTTIYANSNGLQVQ